MRKSVKMGVAGLVLGIGLSAALLFPRHEPLPSATPSPPTDEATLVIRDDRVASQHEAMRPTQHEVSHATAPPPNRPTPAIDGPQAPVTSTAGNLPSRRDPPPTLAPTYEHERLPMTWDDDEPYAGLPSRAQDSSPPRSPAHRLHRVTDGDTLSRLAQRYLGDRRRAGEIFAANRDVLSGPDVLEIGMQLKIPRRQAKPSTNDARRAPLVPVE